MSLYAIHQETGKIVSAESLIYNPEWIPTKEDKWILPDSEIYNLQEIKSKDIVPYCVFVNEHKRLENPVRAHFRSIDENVKTYDYETESEEHKLAKDEIYYKLWDKKLNFKVGGISYSTSDFIGSDIFIEKGIGSKRADVLVIFKDYHPILGKGIVIEIQLSYQNNFTTLKRSYDRALQGYSVVWLNRDDFLNGKLKSEELKVNIVKEVIELYSNEISEEQARQIAIYSANLNKITDEFNKKKNNLEYEIKRMSDEINNLSETLSEKVKKEVYTDLNFDYEKKKFEFKTELNYYIKNLNETAQENYNKANESIKEQKDRLEKAFSNAIENIKHTIKEQAFSRFREEISHISREILEGDEIRGEIKRILSDYISSKQEELKETSRGIILENLKIKNNKIVEEEISKLVNDHFYKRAELFDRAMWDVINRKVDSVINKINVEEIWKKKRE